MIPHDVPQPDLIKIHDRLRWPPDRFFWAILDVKSLPKRRRAARQQFGYLFENVIPGLPIEHVHAQYCKVDSSTLIACGLPAEVLRSSELTDALTLTPDSLPQFITHKLGVTSLPRELHFLTGAYAPKRLRLLGRRLKLLVASIIVVCACSVVFGMERRIDHLQNRLRTIEEHTSHGCLQMVPVGSSHQPPRLRLVAELRRLEQTRSEVAQNIQPDNCGPHLASLLRSWPRNVHLLTESVSITPNAISVRGQVPTMADAQGVADAFKLMTRDNGRWEVGQPQTEARKDRVDLTLRIDGNVAKGAL